MPSRHPECQARPPVPESACRMSYFVRSIGARRSTLLPSFSRILAFASLYFFIASTLNALLRFSKSGGASLLLAGVVGALPEPAAAPCFGALAAALAGAVAMPLNF